MNPLVSIICLAYNHERYIRQCLDGIVAQKIDFSIEIIVHEDASKDNTASIIREYEAKYPEIFRPIYQTENQFSKEPGRVTKNVFGAVKGKYVAMCEGDDYWTDPLKLKKQVDFLEQNPDYNFSMGRVDMLIEETGETKKRREHIDVTKSETYTLKDYLKAPFSQTSSFVFRKIEKMPEWITHAGDQALVIMATADGKIKYHPELLSIYRVHNRGVTKNKIDIERAIARLEEFIKSADKYTGFKYSEILAERKVHEIKQKKMMLLKSQNKLRYYLQAIISRVLGV